MSIKINYSTRDKGLQNDSKAHLQDVLFHIGCKQPLSYL